jgi:hypothetical protein
MTSALLVTKEPTEWRRIPHLTVLDFASVKLVHMIQATDSVPLSQHTVSARYHPMSQQENTE